MWERNDRNGKEPMNEKERECVHYQKYYWVHSVDDLQLNVPKHTCTKIYHVELNRCSIEAPVYWRLKRCSPSARIHVCLVVQVVGVGISFAIWNLASKHWHFQFKMKNVSPQIDEYARVNCWTVFFFIVLWIFRLIFFHLFVVFALQYNCHLEYCGDINFVWIWTLTFYLCYWIARKKYFSIIKLPNNNKKKSFQPMKKNNVKLCLPFFSHSTFCQVRHVFIKRKIKKNKISIKFISIWISLSVLVRDISQQHKTVLEYQFRLSNEFCMFLCMESRARVMWLNGLPRINIKTNLVFFFLWK